ncbi:MAG TPA: hypothetical protein VIT23_02495, partial [Terrimicrobiaceae bacterium]
QSLTPPGGKSTHIEWISLCPMGAPTDHLHGGICSVWEESNFRKQAVAETEATGCDLCGVA